MWWLYQLATAAVLIVAAPVLLLLRGRHYGPTLLPRLGLTRRTADRDRIWIHAVSVGEVAVAAILARALPADRGLLVTTVTPTGQRRAQEVFADRAAVDYLPFDLRWAVSRFLRRWRPSALILVEGELWPYLLRRVKRRGAPVVVVNGRVSDRSYRRMRRLGRLPRLLFAPVDRFGVQSRQDRERLLALGVPSERVTITGNLKFDAADPDPQPELEAELRRRAAGRPLLVAGSTMPGEEEIVLEAFRRAGGGDRALLVLAPRHPERFPRVADRIRAAELHFVRRSELGAGDDTRRAGVEERSEAPAAVVLLDSLGELAGLYRIARGAFVGGTLVPTGGHNPLEPAACGVPVAVGPSMDNFRDMATAFDQHAAWQRVADAGALAAAWTSWLEDPDAASRLGARGRRLAEENRGATERTLELLRPALARPESP